MGLTEEGGPLQGHHLLSIFPPSSGLEARLLSQIMTPAVGLAQSASSEGWP